MSKEFSDRVSVQFNGKELDWKSLDMIKADKNDDRILINGIEFVPIDKEHFRVDLRYFQVYTKTGIKASSDNFAIVVLGCSGNRIYLLDWVAKSKDYRTLKLETAAMIRKYPYYWALIIEQTASGPALTSDLKQHYGRIVEFSPGSPSKYEKASLAAPTFVDGKYYVPSRKLRPDIDSFINQHINFTGEKGKHDDMVDANVIGVIYYMQNKCLSNANFIKTENYSSAPRLFGTRQMTIGSLLPSYQQRTQRRIN